MFFAACSRRVARAPSSRLDSQLFSSSLGPRPRSFRDSIVCSHTDASAPPFPPTHSCVRLLGCSWIRSLSSEAREEVGPQLEFGERVRETLKENECEAFVTLWRSKDALVLPFANASLHVALHAIPSSHSSHFIPGALVFITPPSALSPESAVFLGFVDSRPLFAALFDSASLSALPPHRLSPFRAALPALSRREASLLVRARALLAHAAQHLFCTHCGSELISWRGGLVRKCTSCSHEVYPRLDPCIITLLHSRRSQRALLVRQPTWAPGRFSCIAGFIVLLESGESAEEAVAREVREEVGCESALSVTYVASQTWPTESGAQLMLGYLSAVDDEFLPLLDGRELEAAVWTDAALMRTLLDHHTDRHPARPSCAEEDVNAVPRQLPGAHTTAHMLMRAWLRLRDQTEST